MLFTGLGVWQVERRGWKLALIAAVEARVHAAPAPAPGPADWPDLTAEADAYRHVGTAGVLLHDRTTLVQAVTELGGGYWVLTPLRSDAGFTVLINRGFVPLEQADPATRPGSEPSGHVALTGLLRVTEPGGAFLRSNDPASDRWFSRDVAAIAGVASPLRLVETPPTLRHAPPALGQHTDEVLTELGLDTARIQALLDAADGQTS